MSALVEEVRAGNYSICDIFGRIINYFAPPFDGFVNGKSVLSMVKVVGRIHHLKPLEDTPILKYVYH